MIDLAPAHIQTILRIVKQHVPERRVLAFGSRVTGNAKSYSDLDLVIMGDMPLPFSVIGKLRDDFVESDLPFRIDVIDWASTGEEFRRIIQRDAVPLDASEAKKNS